MKKFKFYFMLTIMLMVAASCSNGGSKNTEISPTSTEVAYDVLESYGTSNEGYDVYDSDGSHSAIDSDFEDVDNSEYSSVSASNDEDWDDVLKSYEAFADRYISILKKASKGDVSALSEYTDYMEEAQSFANKLNSAKGDMTPSQLANFNKIQLKIVKAVSSIKIDPSKIENAMESVSNAISSYGDDDDDDGDDNDDDDDDDE